MRVILFDLDDTLFDHQHSSRAGLAAVQSSFPDRIDGTTDEVEATYCQLLEQWHVKVLAGTVSIERSRIERFRALLSTQGEAASDDEAQAAASCYRMAYDGAYRAVPGSLEILKRLKPESPIAVVTNHVVSEQVKKIAVIGVEPFVDELVVSEEVGVAKPDPKMFHTALSRLGARAEDAVMVGDSWASDIVGATRLGIRSIWLNRYGKPCPDATLATEIQSLQPVDDVVKLILGQS